MGLLTSVELIMKTTQKANGAVLRLYVQGLQDVELEGGSQSNFTWIPARVFYVPIQREQGASGCQNMDTFHIFTYY